MRHFREANGDRGSHVFIGGFGVAGAHRHPGPGHRLYQLQSAWQFGSDRHLGNASGPR